MQWPICRACPHHLCLRRPPAGANSPTGGQMAKSNVSSNSASNDSPHSLKAGWLAARPRWVSSPAAAGSWVGPGCRAKPPVPVWGTKKPRGNLQQTYTSMQQRLVVRIAGVAKWRKGTVPVGSAALVAERLDECQTPRTCWRQEFEFRAALICTAHCLWTHPLAGTSNNPNSSSGLRVRAVDRGRRLEEDFLAWDGDGDLAVAGNAGRGSCLPVHKSCTCCHTSGRAPCGACSTHSTSRAEQVSSRC